MAHTIQLISSLFQKRENTTVVGEEDCPVQTFFGQEVGSGSLDVDVRTFWGKKLRIFLKFGFRL